jgi:membrane protein required for colicin V production
MLLDILAVLLLAIFVLLGATRGALAAGLALVSLVVGYGAAFLLAPALGPSLGSALGVPSLLGGALAGTIAFAVVFVAFAVGGRILRRREAEARGEQSRPVWDRLGGACFGMARGSLVVVLVAWLAHWADAAADARGLDRAPLAGSSAVGDLAQSAVETGVTSLLGDSSPGAKVTARVLARPREALGDLRWVVEQRSVEDLATDRAFWEMVEAGAVDAALRRESFVSVAADRELRMRLAAVGMIEDSSATTPAAFGFAARGVLERVGPRLRQLREDPELHQLAADPEVVYLLEQGQVLGLLQHPGFQRVVARVLSDEATL